MIKQMMSASSRRTGVAGMITRESNERLAKQSIQSVRDLDEHLKAEFGCHLNSMAPIQRKASTIAVDLSKRK
jgi:hypothetical protein